MRRLITNLSSVRLVGSKPDETMLIYCYALVLYGDTGYPSNKIAGFGTSALHEVFIRGVNCLYTDYELREREFCGSKVIGLDLIFKDGTNFVLDPSDSNRPLDVFDHEDPKVIWQVLENKVREYWICPGFPRIVYGPCPKY